MDHSLSALGVNWQEIADQLFAFSRETIHRFASEQPAVISSFFAYDVDLPFFVLSFDTPDNALQVAQRTEQEAIARRAKMLDLPTAWQGARDFSTSPPSWTTATARMPSLTTSLLRSRLMR